MSLSDHGPGYREKLVRVSEQLLDERSRIVELVLRADFTLAVTLPFTYPTGIPVVVRISNDPDPDRVAVMDMGQAFREGNRWWWERKKTPEAVPSLTGKSAQAVRVIHDTMLQRQHNRMERVIVPDTAEKSPLFGQLLDFGHRCVDSAREVAESLNQSEAAGDAIGLSRTYLF